MKPKIEEINVNVDELNKITSLPNNRSKTWKLRQLLGGLCSRCGEIPTRKVRYDVEDAQLVEYYCNKCFNFRKEGRSKKDLDKLN